MKRAVARTMQEAGAAVAIQTQSAISEAAGQTSLQLAGHIDFAADRCRLDGRTGAVVCDGPTQFSQLPDGRWVRQSEPGRWSNLHPRWALELLARAADNATQLGPAVFAVKLDVSRASAITYGGIRDAWAASAEVELDEIERIRGVDIRLRAADAALSWIITYGRFGPTPAIELPPPSRVVELEAHVDELRRRPPA